MEGDASRDASERFKEERESTHIHLDKHSALVFVQTVKGAVFEQLVWDTFSKRLATWAVSSPLVP